jgi:hypothetical protein
MKTKKRHKKIGNTTSNAHLKSSTMMEKLQHHQGKKVCEEKNLTFGIARFLTMMTKNMLSKQRSIEKLE